MLIFFVRSCSSYSVSLCCSDINVMYLRHGLTNDNGELHPNGVNGQATKRKITLNMSFVFAALLTINRVSFNVFLLQLSINLGLHWPTIHASCVCLCVLTALWILKEKKMIGKKKTPRYTVFLVQENGHKYNPKTHHTCYLFLSCIRLCCCYIFPQCTVFRLFCLNVKPYPFRVCESVCVYARIFRECFQIHSLGSMRRNIYCVQDKGHLRPNLHDISGTCLRRKCTDRQFFFIQRYR